MKLTSPNDRNDPDIDVEKYHFGVDHYVKREEYFSKVKGILLQIVIKLRHMALIFKSKYLGKDR